MKKKEKKLDKSAPIHNCNICNGKKFERVLENKDWSSKNENLYQLVKCNNCGLVFLNPRPINMSIHYPEFYEPHKISNDDFFQKIHAFLMGSYYKKKKNAVERLCSYVFKKVYIEIPAKKGAKILDLGCGSGINLYNLNKLGFDTYGIDFSEKAVNFARKELKLKNIKHGNLKSNSYPKNFFDVVILSHVIEHLPDPKKTIILVKKILKKNGQVIITTPNLNSINYRLFKRFWFPLETPRHLFLFSSSTLSNLLERVEGLEISKVKYDISTYSLGRSLAYLFGNNSIANRFWMAIKTLLLPITIAQAMIGKSDIVTIHATKITD